MESIIRTIGQFHEALKPLDENVTLYFEDESSVGDIISWRGVYAEATLDHGITRSPVTVRDMREQIDNLMNGCTLTGYKGGEFMMRAHTNIWADEYGRCDYIAIKGLSIDEENGRVIVHRIKLGNSI